MSKLIGKFRYNRQGQGGGRQFIKGKRKEKGPGNLSFEKLEGGEKRFVTSIHGLLMLGRGG